MEIIWRGYAIAAALTACQLSYQALQLEDGSVAERKQSGRRAIAAALLSYASMKLYKPDKVPVSMELAPLIYTALTPIIVEKDVFVDSRNLQACYLALPIVFSTVAVIRSVPFAFQCLRSFFPDVFGGLPETHHFFG